MTTLTVYQTRRVLSGSSHNWRTYFLPNGTVLSAHHGRQRYNIPKVMGDGFEKHITRRGMAHVLRFWRSTSGRDRIHVS